VWIYKGDILPYKSVAEDKITREAAMAVGETSGAPRPRTVVSSAAAQRRRPAAEPGEQPPPAAPAAAEPTEEEVMPLIKEADPEFERLLAEEEEIERSTREHPETPHFRMGDD
jgi:small subunit ribosomal protein S3